MTIWLNHVGLEKVQALPNEVSWVMDLPRNSNADFKDFKSLKLQYTSLRDLMVASSSKKGVIPQFQETEWYNPLHVNLKDKLLKEAARAYLQPKGKAAIPKVCFFERLWTSFAVKNKSLVDFAKEHVWESTKGCAMFVRARVQALIQQFKPRSVPFLRRTPKLLSF